MKKYKKIILWGAKMDTRHTHAFIHEACYRACKYMGLDVYWLDNRDRVDNSFFDDAIVITEQWLVFNNPMADLPVASGQPISDNMPLNKSACYIVHYLGNLGPIDGNPGAAMYLGNVGKLVEFRFTAVNGWGINGQRDKNYAYEFKPEKYEAFNDVSYFQRLPTHDVIYTIWATDLLPDEINFEDRFTPLEPTAFFCGTIREDNRDVFESFIKKCKDNKIPFVYNNPWVCALPTDAIRQQIATSLLPVDCRPKNHLANGYISCRSIKNVSYGALGMTNSKPIYDFFEGDIAYAPDSGDLFDVALEMQANPKTKDLILRHMKRIKEQHTYVNRIKDFIRAAEM
jgi:hypothetical protein